MRYEPYKNMVGGFSETDGTIDFYSRINALIDKEMTVLDLGAGRAAWFEDDENNFRKSIRLLKGKVAKVIAVDVDDAVLKNNACDECYLMCDGTIPVADNTIDLIVSDYVLEHVQDAKEYFKEVDRVLKSGGWFCARTPHKFSYVSLSSRLANNATHSKLLKYIQPSRKEIDVFPTYYRLNTMGDVEKVFLGYENFSFVFRADPSYFFGSRIIFHIQKYLQRVLHKEFSGNLFLYLKKP